MRTVEQAKYIYISGPYSSDRPEEVFLNVQRAEEAAKAVLLKGHVPFCPHTMTCGWETDHRLRYEDFLRMDLAWIARCDWFLYLRPSPGADQELAKARARGMAVFDSVDEVPEVAIRNAAGDRRL